MGTRSEESSGLREGIARSCSQACIFGLEARKTLLQVHGYIPKLPSHIVLHRWTVGMLTSTITSGVVFGTYFSVYNRLQPEVYAGTVASLITSVIKIPISNGMRLMQSGNARNLLSASRKIVKRHSWRGLYTGYVTSLFEDIIEFDVRARLYRALKNQNGARANEKSPLLGLTYGALCGACASAITTPFDTIRSKLIVNASHEKLVANTFHIAHALFATHGLKGLYRGVGIRMLSNAVKSAIFFSIYEMIPNL